MPYHGFLKSNKHLNMLYLDTGHHFFERVAMDTQI